MSNVVRFRDAILAELEADTERFPGVKFSVHGGSFDTETELKRYAKQTPAVVISIMRVDFIEDLVGEPKADCIVGAFVVTQDKKGAEQDRATTALSLTENLLHYVGCKFPRRDWGVDAEYPKNVIARNAYAKTFDDDGVAVWGVFWEQRIPIEGPIPAVEDALEAVHVDYDLSPRDNDAELAEVIDAEDIVTLPIPVE